MARKKNIGKVKSLVNPALPTVTPLTKRSGVLGGGVQNISTPQAPINQTPPSFGGSDGLRRRRLGAQMQRATINRHRGK